MGKSTFTIVPGVVIEYIDREAMVLLPGSTSVMRLNAEQARTLRAIESDRSSTVSVQTAQSLIQAGIVATHPSMSRRSLIKAGAIGAGAGIAVMAMPSVAAASSGPSGDFTFIVSRDNGTTVGEVKFLNQGSAPPPADMTDGTLTGGGVSQTFRWFDVDVAWIAVGIPVVPMPPETLEYEVAGVTYTGVYVAQ
jgi:hypothetical protein